MRNTNNNCGYCVAYSDKDKKDFHGVPWLDGYYDNINEAVEVKNVLVNEGYADATVFLNLGDEETITWDYVNNHLILENNCQ